MSSTTAESKLVLPSKKYYNDEDIQKYVSSLLNENKPVKMKKRNDLNYGNIVIVLEGEFISKRVVYLGCTRKNMAICVGPRSINGVPLFIINEKYLLKTSTVLNIQKVKIPHDTPFYESNEDIFSKKMDNIENITDLERQIDEIVYATAKKTKFMVSYLKTDFDAREVTDLLKAKF